MPDNRRILLVDDDRFFLLLLGKKLSTAGFQITSLLDPQEALRRLAQETFDVVISDLEMPEVSGLRVLEVARQTQPAARLFLITATSRDECAVPPDVTYVQKPLTHLTLLALLRP